MFAYSTIYGFMSTVIGLFLANMCVINKVSKAELGRVVTQHTNKWDRDRKPNVSRKSMPREVVRASCKDFHSTPWIFPLGYS
jgi:hypothetical protein